jgi:hypothetical protein
MARHRLVTGTGLGNPEPAKLDNKGYIYKPFADAAMKEYFSREEGFDFHRDRNTVAVGIEPTYQGDPLRIITIRRNKAESTIEQGRAFGYYGSGVRKSVRRYADYKYNSKFKRFVDAWHRVLFEE